MLSTFYIKDGHDRIQDVLSAPALRDLADVREAAARAKAVKDVLWDNRRITSHGTYFGDPNYQWFAKIPGRLATFLDKQYPGWDADEDMIRTIAQEYPECRVLPEEHRG